MKPNITGCFLGIAVVLTGWQGLRSGLAQTAATTQIETTQPAEDQPAETQTPATLSPTSQAREWSQSQALSMGNTFRDDDSGPSAAEATKVSAALTQKLTSKNAKVGDSVSAKTLSEARLSNGTKLPKGTKLVGHVTEVQAKGGEHHDGHIAFLFDRAVLRDGQEIPIRAGLQSISAPAAATTSDADALYAGGGGGSMNPGVGGGRTTGGGLAGGPIGGGGGALGNSPSTLGNGTPSMPGNGLPSTPGNGLPSALDNGASLSRGNAAGNVPSMADGTASGVQAAGGGEVDQTAGIRVRSGTSAGSGTNVAGGPTSIPVRNLPGVTANGAASAWNASGVLDARGRNVDLSGGTQMVLAVTAQDKASAKSVE
jgi:hypothetical protein